jgi:hypothetical protein
MLKLAWYLITDLDYWQEATRFPQPALVREPADRLTRLFSDDGPFTPAHTVAATDIMLQAAAYLSDAVRHGAATVPDRAHLDRLLHGLNLLLAYAAQAGGRLAHQTDTGTGPDLSDLSPTDREDVARALAAATGRLEEAAGLVKEAHLSARSRQAARR